MKNGKDFQLKNLLLVSYSPSVCYLNLCIFLVTQANFDLDAINATHAIPALMYTHSPTFFELQAIILILSAETVSLSNLNVAFFKIKVHTSSH